MQHLIPFVWQSVPAKVPVEGRVVDYDKHDILYGPGDTLGLPVHDGEIVKLDCMTRVVGVVIDGGAGS